MPSITYVMVRSAKGASRTTHGGRAAPGFRFETNSFTRSKTGTYGSYGTGWSPSSGRHWPDPWAGVTRLLVPT